MRIFWPKRNWRIFTKRRSCFCHREGVWGSEGKLLCILNSTLGGGESSSASCLDFSLPRERARCALIRDLVGPRTGLDAVRNSSRPSAAPSSKFLYLDTNLHLLQLGTVVAVGRIVEKKSLMRKENPALKSVHELLLSKKLDFELMPLLH